jgi:hypothetical protein
LPTIAPMPNAAASVAQAEAPPSERFATTGPRTLKAAMTATWKKAKLAMLVHSQRRETTSRQPTASSWKKRSRARGGSGGRRKRVSR